jgi:hypothetical protein
MGAVTNAYRILVGIPERKRLLDRPGTRLDYNFKMDNKQTGCGHVDCALLYQDRMQ